MRPEDRSLILLQTLILLGSAPAARATEVSICTSQGVMTVETFDTEAPLHAANFLEYVDRGYYSGTVFHRVIPGFMIQAGGYDQALRAKQTQAPIANESQNGLSNLRGMIAAARTNDPDSATAQFFVNVVDNTRLDARPGAPGYTVFARVTAGMDVADAIAALPTRALGPFASDVPNPLVTIESAARLDAGALAGIPEAGRGDALRARVLAAVGAENPAEAMQWIRHYRAACETMDRELLLIEAESAAGLLRAPRARSALDEYFGLVDDSDAGYGRALELYEQVAPGEQPRVGQLIGNCAPPSRPEIPDGKTASMDAMIDGQTRVRAFMSESETYLDCLSTIINESATSDEQEAQAVQEHNRMVTVMENLAEEFNSQLRAFRARQ